MTKRGGVKALKQFVGAVEAGQTETAIAAFAETRGLSIEESFSYVTETGLKRLAALTRHQAGLLRGVPDDKAAVKEVRVLRERKVRAVKAR